MSRTLQRGSCGGRIRAGYEVGRSHLKYVWSEAAESEPGGLRGVRENLREYDYLERLMDIICSEAKSRTQRVVIRKRKKDRRVADKKNLPMKGEKKVGVLQTDRAKGGRGGGPR